MPERITLETGGPNPPNAEQKAEIRETLGAASDTEVAALTGGKRFFVLNPTILGTTPTDPHILAHLGWRSSSEVEVDYPENITAVGKVTHQQVLAAAEASLLTGSSGQGSVFLQVGTYALSSTLTLDARTSLIGGGRQLYGGGTKLNAEAGFTGSFLVQSVNSGSPDPDASGNFETHWRDIHLDCNSLCSGFDHGGAWCSSLENVYILDPTTYGAFLRTGSLAMRIQDVAILNGTYGIYAEDGVDGLSLVNISSEGTYYGISLGSGAHGLVGAHIKGARYPLHLRSADSQLDARGVHVQSPVQDAGTVNLVSAPSGAVVSVAGVLRDTTDPSTGWLRGGTFVHLMDQTGVPATTSYPFTIDTEHGKVLISDVVGALTISANEAGKALFCNGTFDLTVNDGSLSAEEVVTIKNDGVGVITLVAGAGVTINGTLVIASGELIQLLARSATLYEVMP